MNESGTESGRARDGSFVPAGGADVLLVDDERSVREFLAIFLRRAGHRVQSASGTVEARQLLESHEFAVVLTDLAMPDGSGLDVLAAAKARAIDTEVIVVTAYATAETAIAAMKAGAYDYLLKPFKVDEVGLAVARALERRTLFRQNVALRDELKGRYRLNRLLGKAPAMTRLFEMLTKIAPVRTSVLVVGESGTGKELAARALHELSPRAEGPFIAVNCGAIPESLLESELFGHKKGAFTGAATDKQGLFEAAHGGTLLLDEVGELPLSMQVKLLRVLQERKVKPVGSVNEREVDVRVVAATNRDLEAEVEKGTFRQDLFYRLNVIQVRMPPLRERREDVPLLALHFVEKFAAEHGRPPPQIDSAAMSRLVAYGYPGNVRQLENIIERAVTLTSGAVLTPEALPELVSSRVAAPHLALSGEGVSSLPEEGLDLETTLADFERAILLKALDRTKGNRTEAARYLGISFRSMRYRLSKLGLTPPEEDDGRPGASSPGPGSPGATE